MLVDLRSRPWRIGQRVHIIDQDCTGDNAATLIEDLSHLPFTNGAWNARNAAGVVFGAWKWTHRVCFACSLRRDGRAA